MGSLGAVFRGRRSITGYAVNTIVSGLTWAEALHDLPEGGAVVDATVLAPEVLVKALLMEPMLDLGLEGDAVDAFDAKDVSPTLAEGLEGDFRSLLKGALAGVVSLDSVGLERWLGYWRSLGARIGRRDGDMLRWEDGQEEPITEGGLS